MPSNKVRSNDLTCVLSLYLIEIPMTVLYTTVVLLGQLCFIGYYGFYRSSSVAVEPDAEDTVVFLVGLTLLVASLSLGVINT